MNPTPPEVEGERLQKVLAGAGVASRRAAEILIAAGRVSVNGAVVDRQGVRVDPRTAVIHVDGKRLVLDPSMLYFALNKPPGVITAMTDARHRPNVGDLVARHADGGEVPRGARVFHVGRLDVDSEGLVLLTNDGELANRLTHPSYGIEKTYIAEVPGPMEATTRQRLLAGVPLDGRSVEVHRIKIVGRSRERLLVELAIHEGRNHVVRRLLEEVGHPVSRLVRTRMGPVVLGSMPHGELRGLSRDEVGGLHRAVGL